MMALGLYGKEHDGSPKAFTLAAPRFTTWATQRHAPMQQPTALRNFKIVKVGPAEPAQEPAAESDTKLN